jgi:hypothetical protein
MANPPIAWAVTTMRQVRQLREYSAFDQSDQGSRIHRTARKQRPDQPVRRHRFGERLQTDGMHEHRYAELRGDLERGARLRRVNKQIPACAVDEQFAQSEFADGPLGLTRRALAVVTVHRC